MSTSLLSAIGLGPVSIINRYQPEVDAWVDKLSYRPSAPTLEALSTLVSRARQGGWLTSLPGFFPFVTLDLDLKCYSLFDPTRVLDPYNASLGAIYSPGIGVVGTGAIGGEGFYFQGRTDVDADNWGAADNFAFGAFMQTASTDEGLFSATSAGSRMGLFPVNGNGRFQFYPASGTNGVTLTSLKQGQGVAAVVRTSASGGQASGGGIPQAWLEAAGALPIAPPRFFRFQNSYSPNTLSFGFYGQLDPAQVTLINAAILEFHNSLDTLLDVPPPTPFGDNCFDIQMVPTPPTWRQFRLSRRPTDDAETKATFATGPLTDSHSSIGPSLIASTDTRIGFWRRIWDNRARTAGLKDNGAADGVVVSIGELTLQCRMTYGTISKASGATLIQAGQTLGLLPRDDARMPFFQDTYRAAGWGWLDIGDYYGYDTSKWAPYLNDDAVLNDNVNVDTGDIAHQAFYQANAASIFTGTYLNTRVVTDRVCLYNYRITTITPSTVIRGLWLDSERKDGLSGTQRIELSTGLNQICAALNLNFIVSTNRRDTGASSGWTNESCLQLVGLSNLAFTNLLIPNEANAAAVTTSLNTQLNLFRLGGVVQHPEKLTMAMGLGPDTNLLPTAYATIGYDFAVANSFGGNAITPSSGSQGGQLARQQNQLIAIMNGLPTS
jgi:hypothetical protein